MLTEKTFLQYALKAYDNPACLSLDEFKQDLDRFSHIKKAITRYKDGSSDLKERLLMNHLVICFNVFGIEALDFLLFKVPRENWDVLFPFLILLDRLPETFDGELMSEVELNKDVIESLRKMMV